MRSFGDRLASTVADHGRLCLGIDPHAFLLEEWGLPDSAEGARDFGLRVVEGAAGRVGIVKPQVAFFERHGASGYAALEAVLAAARSAGLLVIADAKRGDIGSTVAAYGESWLTPGSPLEADALTVVAYQGVASLAGPIELARAHGKGLFVLAATSNPEAFTNQTAVRGSGSTVAAGIVDEVGDLNADATVLGPFGVVIGATVRLADFGISADSLRRTPILAPGFGEQGALVSDVGALFGAVADNVVVAVSRGALRAGPAGLPGALDRLAGELRDAL
ncbi:orotidine-5'-phosphate decarboxylase [soil metagenome]